ncbi:MAG TPA: hypothetical protein VJQ59_16970 [Candidatus Sulfotelmatobacter sp.]|nr:hypothetical protein [Candidatus Sulfotelmatobacter sp.]
MPNMVGNTITKPGDLNMGGYQKLAQPRKGKTPNFTAEGGASELAGGVSKGHDALVTKGLRKSAPIRNIKASLTKRAEKTPLLGR